MNLDYLLWHLPKLIPDFPFFRPDGLGMSILLTSPAPPARIPRAVARSADVAAWRGVRVHAHPEPPLLRRRLAPVRLSLRARCHSVRDRPLRDGRRVARPASGWWWVALIAFGVLVNAAGVYWAYHL